MQEAGAPVLLSCRHGAAPWAGCPRLHTPEPALPGPLRQAAPTTHHHSTQARELSGQTHGFVSPGKPAARSGLTAGGAGPQAECWSED